MSDGSAAGRGPRRQVLALALVLAAFAALAIPLALSLNVWQDETYSLRTTSGSFAQAWHSAVEFEALPPLYPLLLEAWRALDRSVPFARLFSVLCACGAIACMWAFARRQLANVPATAVAAAFALAPFLVYAAIEIRLYALVVLLAAALLLTYFAGFVNEPPNFGARAGHVALAVAAMYTQYFVGALLLGFFVALVAARRLRAARDYALAGAIVTAACLPIAWILPDQLSTFRTTSGTTHYSAASVAVTALTFVLPHEWIPRWAHGAKNIAYWAAFVGLAGLLAAARPRLAPAPFLLACVTLTIAAFFAIVPPALHQTLVTPRHLAVLLVPALATAFAVIDSLRARGRPVLIAYLATYALFACLSLGTTYGSGAKFGDFKRAGAFLEANVRPGQTVFVFDQEMTTPLSYYYHGAAPLVGLPEPQRFDRFDARRFVFHSDAEVRAKLGAVRPHATVWLYETDLCAERGDPFGCRFLEDVVRSDYEVVRERAFHEAGVRELVRRG